MQPTQWRKLAMIELAKPAAHSGTDMVQARHTDPGCHQVGQLDQAVFGRRNLSPCQFPSRRLLGNGFKRGEFVDAGIVYENIEAMSNPDTPDGCLATHTAALLADPKTDIGRKILAIAVACTKHTKTDLSEQGGRRFVEKCRCR
jgi:hypothetical protein